MIQCWEGRFIYSYLCFLNSTAGKDFLIEALKFHLLKGEQKCIFKTPRTKPRQPRGLPKVLLVVGGQAPKAIRSVECYDFKEEKWYQVSELPTRRCRAGKRLYFAISKIVFFCFS